MAEYIDRENLLRDIDHYHVSDGKFQHWVEIQLAADVAPVVHGHWVYKRRRSGGFRIRTGILKNGERVKVLIDEREDTHGAVLQRVRNSQRQHQRSKYEILPALRGENGRGGTR